MSVKARCKIMHMNDFLLRDITIHFFLFFQLKKRKKIYYHNDITRINVAHEHKA